MPTDIFALAQEITILAVPVLLAITCHEVAHGYVAFLLGDSRGTRDCARRARAAGIPVLVVRESDIA